MNRVGCDTLPVLTYPKHRRVTVAHPQSKEGGNIPPQMRDAAGAVSQHPTERSKKV